MLFLLYFFISFGSVGVVESVWLTQSVHVQTNNLEHTLMGPCKAQILGNS